MKKRIALLSAVVLLVSLFSFATMPVSAGTEDPKGEASVGDIDTADYFYDFSSSTAYTKESDRLFATGNSKIEYDNTVGALKVSTVDGSTTNIGGITLGAWREVSGAGAVETNILPTYPVFAMKVKFARDDMGSIPASTVGVQARGFGSQKFTFGTEVTYEETTEWQLLIFNVPNGYWKGDTNSYWAGVVFPYLTTNEEVVGGENTDLAWIGWAGAFKSEADAQNYFAQTTNDSADSNLEISKVGARYNLDANGNQGLRFYHDLTTTVEEDKSETVMYNGKKLTVKSVNVLMAKEDTLKGLSMTAADLTKDRIGTANVANVKVTTCRSRVEAGGKATYSFTALLTGVNQGNKATYVACRSYLECEDEEGNPVTVYSNVIVTSVQDVYDFNGASSFGDDVQAWMAA